MPRIPAGKKALRESMQRNRQPFAVKRVDNETDEHISDVKIPDPGSSLNDSKEGLSAPSKTPLSEKQLNQLKGMTAKFVKNKEEESKRKEAESAKMKLLREKRTTKYLRKRMVDSDNDSDDENPNDDISGDLEDVSNCPDSQMNELIAPVIPPTPTSSRPLKSPDELSRSQKFKRIRAFQTNIKETVGEEFKLVHSDKIVEQLSLYEATKFKVLNNISDAQYGALDRRLYPCLSNVKNYSNDLTDKLKDQRKDGLANFIINDINSMDSFPFETARINFGVDEGGDSTKVVVSYVDLPDPQSVKRVRVYKVIYGHETRHELEPFIEEINIAVKFLQHGKITTKHGDKTFICFFIADCKCGDTVTGLQGGSSLRPCLYCKIHRDKWATLKEIPPSELRTIEEIRAAGLIIEKAEAENLPETKLKTLKQEQNNVKATPLSTEIPITRFVPDTVHLDMCAVNSAIQYCKKKKELCEILFSEIEKCGVQLTQGRSEYNGPNCRKILKHFVDHPNIDGYGIDLLRSFANVEKYSVARTLTEDEIDEMEKAIKDYFEIIDTKYPDLPGRKTKLHMLRHHVMPFVREHKSWGLFSAQALEGTHKIKNRTNAKVQGKSPLAKNRQLEFFMNQQMLINFFTSKSGDIFNDSNNSAPVKQNTSLSPDVVSQNIEEDQNHPFYISPENSLSPKKQSSLFNFSRKRKMGSDITVEKDEAPLKFKQSKILSTIQNFDLSAKTNTAFKESTSTFTFSKIQKSLSESYQDPYPHPRPEFSTNSNYFFNPPDEEWFENTCKILEADPSETSNSPLRSMPQILNIVSLPFMCKRIVGDGNCGYRALSFLLFGTEKYHWVIRRKLTKWRMEWAEEGAAEKWEEIKDQIVERRTLGEENLYFDDLDMIGFCRMFNANILIFTSQGVDTPRWRCYSPGDNRNFMQKNGYPCLCIKLHEKHFEAIIGFC